MEKRKLQKKVAQKNLAVKSRDARFITEYVKRKAPALYNEADLFLKTLRQRYPDKRDYTKTHEFLVNTTQFADHADYYKRKKKEQYKRKATRTTTTTTTTTTVDDIELNVVLLPESVVEENTGPLQVLPDHVYKDLIDDLSNDPILRPIFNDMTGSHEVNDGQELDPEVSKLIDGLTETPLEKELLNT